MREVRRYEPVFQRQHVPISRGVSPRMLALSDSPQSTRDGHGGDAVALALLAPASPISRGGLASTLDLDSNPTAFLQPRTAEWEIGGNGQA